MVSTLCWETVGHAGGTVLVCLLLSDQCKGQVHCVGDMVREGDWARMAGLGAGSPWEESLMGSCRRLGVGVADPDLQRWDRELVLVNTCLAPITFHIGCS